MRLRFERWFDWPTRSPDLNPMEHMGQVLGRQVRARNSAPAAQRSLPRVLGRGSYNLFIAGIGTRGGYTLY